MLDYRFVNTVGIIGAVFFGIIAGMNILDWYNDVGDWCETGSTIKCVREWTSALSGYVAAIGAIIAAKLTLPLLNRQVTEAKRQSDFMLGDAVPTFRITLLAGATVQVRCVNWNRRDYVINSVILTDENGAFDVRSFKSARDNGKLEDDRGLGFYSSWTVFGWENRNNKPNTITFVVDVNTYRKDDGTTALPKAVFIAGFLAENTETTPFSQQFTLMNP